MKKSYSPSVDLKKLIEDWVEAEYSFRHGKNAHSRATSHWLMLKEDAMRKSVTGQTSLPKARREIVDRDKKPKSKYSKKTKRT